jgi:hypothetical protein
MSFLHRYFFPVAAIVDKADAARDQPIVNNSAIPDF